MRKLKKEIWPYQVLIKLPNPIDVEGFSKLDAWCSETIGRRFSDWYGYWEGVNGRIYSFKDEATLLVFKITWGHYGTW